MRSRYAAGIVNYRAYADLERCLASLEAQSVAPSRIAVVDHHPDEARFAAARAARPGVIWHPEANRGFAAGANRALALATQRDPGIDFFLLLNPDVHLDPKFVETLLHAMIEHPDVALASGKLLRPDGRTIDSTGIAMPRNRRPRDRGSGEIDRGQYEGTERVFAVSGAVLMIRRAAVPDLEVDGELFDEDFFTYHEDTDLGWRARLFGWSSLYVSEARAIHRRGWQRAAWREIDPAIRRHSFKNHYLEMIKNERATRFLRDLPVILSWELMRLGYAVLRDRTRIPAYAAAYRLAGRAWAKRRVIRRRIQSANATSHE